MFNEVTYVKCIKHLVAIKTIIVILFTLIFLIIGLVLGLSADNGFFKIIGPILGGIIGFALGLASTWRIEMHIQESYWRIDMLRAVKNKNINNI